MEGNHIVDKPTKTIRCHACDGTGRFSDAREWRDRMNACNVTFSFKTMAEAARTINRLGYCDCDLCQGEGKQEVEA